MTEHRLPYFDYLLAELAKLNSAIEKSFGRHVHWGYWDDPAKARGDDDDYARAAEQLTVELCRLAGIAEGEKILDVGCGFGGTIASLNERFNRLSLTGLNIDAGQLARARQQVQPLHENDVTFCQGDACALPFHDESFDRLLAVECIFHFPSREVFFKEAFRVLRPGGILVLSDFVPSPLYLPVAWLTISGRAKTEQVLGHLNVQYTIGRYRRLARQSGLVPVVERNITRNTLPTYRYLQRLVEPIAEVPGAVLRTLEILGAIGMMNYYLLSFRKP